jgi:hypothetical protein
MLTTFSGTVGGQLRQVLLYQNWKQNISLFTSEVQDIRYFNMQEFSVRKGLTIEAGEMIDDLVITTKIFIAFKLQL